MYQKRKKKSKKIKALKIKAYSLGVPKRIERGLLYDEHFDKKIARN